MCKPCSCACLHCDRCGHKSGAWCSVFSPSQRGCSSTARHLGSRPLTATGGPGGATGRSRRPRAAAAAARARAAAGMARRPHARTPATLRPRAARRPGGRPHGASAARSPGHCPLKRCWPRRRARRVPQGQVQDRRVLLRGLQPRSHPLPAYTPASAPPPRARPRRQHTHPRTAAARPAAVPRPRGARMHPRRAERALCLAGRRSARAPRPTAPWADGRRARPRPDRRAGVRPPAARPPRRRRAEPSALQGPTADPDQGPWQGALHATRLMRRARRRRRRRRRRPSRAQPPARRAGSRSRRAGRPPRPPRRARRPPRGAPAPRTAAPGGRAGGRPAAARRGLLRVHGTHSMGLVVLPRTCRGPNQVFANGAGQGVSAVRMPRNAQVHLAKVTSCASLSGTQREPGVASMSRCHAMERMVWVSPRRTSASAAASSAVQPPPPPAAHSRACSSSSECRMAVLHGRRACAWESCAAGMHACRHVRRCGPAAERWLAAAGAC